MRELFFFIIISGFAGIQSVHRNIKGAREDAPKIIFAIHLKPKAASYGGIKSF